MRKIKLGKSNLEVPVIAVGCMRMNRLEKKAIESFIRNAIDLGANFFDHADIYGRSACEEVFAEGFAAIGGRREDIILQTKCGIVPGRMYDFSKEHIVSSVEGSLRRLKTDYIDILLLHRPDALMEPEEVAEAFEALHSAGKVRNFGVSNQNPGQMRLLQKYIKYPIVADQLQLSITNATMITQGIHVNRVGDEYSVSRDVGVLDFCRLEDITIQPWSPFQYGIIEGVFIGSPKYPELNKKLTEMAQKYGVSETTITVAWLLRHPAKMQPVTGTMNEGRLADCAKAADVTLSREDWYALLLSAGSDLP
ncbi:MAG: aldo/keto reductase [Oscillospiraceae bacterium]|nr:aldo/keto reductase [Oscillospiraceae bacterium]